MTTLSTHVNSVLRIRANEGRLVILVTSLMFFTSAGVAIGTPGIEALFYKRFGVEFLPYMYVALGIVTILVSLLITALLARAARERLYVLLPLALAIIFGVERFLITFDFSWFYPVLWLTMSVTWTLQNLFTWGLAGMVCDTRQAKRLFPLFGVGGIIGLTIGSLATKLLVEFIDAENLILIWSSGLVISFAISQSLVKRSQAPAPRRMRGSVSPLQELQKGYRFARRSPLIAWMARAAVLFAILYYALVFPFAKSVAAEFPDENDLAGFLGIFQGVSTAVAILVSLLVANRLYARLGFMTTIFILPLIYLVGYAALAIQSAFAVLVGFRFAQLAWMTGVSDGANQALYNVVPDEHREQTRAFVRGVANQLGISLAGVMLFLADQVLQPQQLFIIGSLAAVVTTYFVWQARRAYGPAVVNALRAGQSLLFFSEEEPFGGFRRDASAVAAAVAGISSPEPSVRRVSAEILGRLALPEATDAIVRALDDDDASVRAALLRAIARARASPALLEVLVCLDDPDPEVRLRAIEAVAALAGYPGGIVSHVQPLLKDPDPAVRCRAAAVLVQMGEHHEAEETLIATATSENLEERLQGLHALAEWGGQAAYDVAAQALVDSRPAVRRVAATILSHIDAEQCTGSLIDALADDDQTVREAVAEAIGRVGESALKLTIDALRDPSRETGALLALQHLPAHKASSAIREFARKKVERALRYHELWRVANQLVTGGSATQDGSSGKPEPFVGGVQNGASDGLTLLCDALRYKSWREGTKALLAAGLLGDVESVSLAVENLGSRLPSQRANAIETLESVADPHVVRPLLALWEPSEGSTAVRDGWLVPLLSDPDPWLRACAALAARDIDDKGLASGLRRLAESDPEGYVRDTARASLNGRAEVDGPLTLSLMERILCFRRVRLFADLPPDDLRHIAEVAGEIRYSSGETIAQQGEPGDIMYIVVSGVVDVLWEDENGSRSKIDEAGPGEYVGEMAIINRERRTATLIAASNVHALWIDQAEFETIIRLRPEASLAVMRVLSRRLRREIALRQAQPSTGTERDGSARPAKVRPATTVRVTGKRSLDRADRQHTLPTLSLMERIIFFRRVPLFADLPPADLKQIAAVANEQLFSAGETIARQGEPGDIMYIVVSGSVDVVSEDADGAQTKIGQADPGEYVGEMAILSQEVRAATMIAATDVRALYIDQGEFEEIIRLRPEARPAVMRVLSRRLSSTIAAQRGVQVPALHD